VLRASQQHPERGVRPICFLGFRFRSAVCSLKTGRFVQRLFSTFPDGWPGTGLVFLRALTAIPLVQFIAGPLTPSTPLSLPLQFLAATCSVLLMVGLWTPIAGLVMAVAELCLLLFHLSTESLHIVLVALGIALAMIGPGAWSVDARLFGRKRIRIPQR